MKNDEPRPTKATARWGKLPEQLPDRYDVHISVHPTGHDEVALNVELNAIKRTDIMAPDYGAPAVRALVRQLEEIVWGVPLDKEPAR